MPTDVENLFGESTESEDESVCFMKDGKELNLSSVGKRYHDKTDEKADILAYSSSNYDAFLQSLPRKKRKVGKVKQLSKSLKTKILSPRLSKRGRLESLKAKRLLSQNVNSSSNEKPLINSKEDNQKEYKEELLNNKNYQSEDSYQSVLIQRTKEDVEFIDCDDEDPEALRELYKEQNFSDEWPTGKYSDTGRLVKTGKETGKKKRSVRGPDTLSDSDWRIENNPIVIAMRKMRKKKKVVKKLHELEQIAEEFLTKMDLAANEDELLLKQRKPATRKLGMLPEVLEMLAKRDMMRPLLEADFLSVAGRWIKPLPDGKLGNVTLRRNLLSSISKMTGEKGISSNDLKRSDFGKVVMSIYMHHDETRLMKRQLKSLIEQWSRPIFKKSGNMRDLGRAYSLKRRNDTGLTGYIAKSKSSSLPEQHDFIDVDSLCKKSDNDFSSVISRKVRTSRNLGSNRVCVPYSKGFQYTIQPDNLSEGACDIKSRITKIKNGRESLHIRMLEKSRSVLKNQHSVNISIEGRPLK